MSGAILLATINAKWIHPSLALRLLKANLGGLESRCDIIEFALRQPLREKIDPILAAQPRILGLSVSVWNHAATLELLEELWAAWETGGGRPCVVLGGPEVSYLPSGAELFRYADYCIAGEGEIAFRQLCEAIYSDGNAKNAPGSDRIACLEDGKVFSETRENFSAFFPSRELQVADVTRIESGCRLYTDEDLRKKLVYVEASRGCPFSCEFCLSAGSSPVREFPLEPFFAEMDGLIDRGARTIKFLDRTFNANIDRARAIMEYFLGRIGQGASLVVHFEMVPSRFPPELMETAARFPPGTLRLEIGVQTLNPEVSARISRPSKPEQELAAIRRLRETTGAIIHADLIAGLPGEDMASFGRGFGLLWEALSPPSANSPRCEIQLGILKLLPGAPIARHSTAFGMRYNPSPPYELMESAAMPMHDLDRIKNFARFWEIVVNRGLIDVGTAFGAAKGAVPVFDRFMALSDSLFTRFGRNWGIAKNDLMEVLREKYTA
ncbi:MAG: B12-binding domain-containing radical SAM protein [Treponema sp.]|nr:B12-binding domain-containing radical SAM protein [Treponema sp.]